MLVWLPSLVLWSQRHECQGATDAVIVFVLPATGLFLGMMTGDRLRRTYGTTFASWTWAFVAVIIALGIQGGTWALLNSAGLRDLLSVTLSISMLFFFVIAVGPLVNGRR